MKITDVRAGTIWRDKKYSRYAACPTCTVLSVNYEVEEVLVDYNGGRRYRFSEFEELWEPSDQNDKDTTRTG